LLWKRRCDSNLQFRIEAWQTIHLVGGGAFQVDVEESVHASAGNRNAATLLERSHDADPPKKEHQNRTFDEHLVAEREMISAGDGHSPASSCRNAVLDRLNVPFDRLGFWS